MVATRACSCPASTLSFWGLINSCQFFWNTVFPHRFPDRGGSRCPIRSMAKRVLTRMLRLNAAALGSAAAIVRNGCHVADRRHVEADCLQRAQCRFASCTRTTHFDLEGAHAVLDRFLGGVFGGDLRGIGRRFARTLESERARRRPRYGIALPVGDGDDRVVERRVHMRDARHDVLLFLLARARGCFCHYFVTFFLPAMARAGPLRVRALVWVR